MLLKIKRHYREFQFQCANIFGVLHYKIVCENFGVAYVLLHSRININNTKHKLYYKQQLVIGI